MKQIKQNFFGKCESDFNLMTADDFINDPNNMRRGKLGYTLTIEIQIKDKTWNFIIFAIIQIICGKFGGQEKNE